MMRKILLLPALIVLAGFMLAGCGGYGQVEQGVVVAVDEKNRTVTIIPQTNSKNPREYGAYDRLPVEVWNLPEDRSETGAMPDAGLRANVNVKNSTITMYDPDSKAFDVIQVEVIEDVTDVDLRRRHPLVTERHPTTRRWVPKKFPIIDREKQTIQIYDLPQKRVTTFRVEEEWKEKYADDWMWNSGCEVRMYFVEKGKSLRFMNITKTDITRR